MVELQQLSIRHSNAAVSKCSNHFRALFRTQPITEGEEVISRYYAVGKSVLRMQSRTSPTEFGLIVDVIVYEGSSVYDLRGKS